MNLICQHSAAIDDTSMYLSSSLSIRVDFYYVIWPRGLKQFTVAVWSLFKMFFFCFVLFCFRLLTLWDRMGSESSKWGTFTALFEHAHAKLSHCLGNRLLLSTENITTLHLDFPLTDNTIFSFRLWSKIRMSWISSQLRVSSWNGHDWTHFFFHFH